MKKLYILLDFGGNIEEEEYMTDEEAKKKNDVLQTKERFLRWSPKYSDYINKTRIDNNE